VGPVRQEAIEDQITDGWPGWVGIPSVVHMTDRDPLPPSASSTSASTSTSLRSRLGLPLLAIVALALLAAPRVILHDLGIIQEGTAINALFVFLPPLLWLVLVLAARVPNVFLTIFAIGLCYAVFLAVGHQITWSV